MKSSSRSARRRFGSSDLQYEPAEPNTDGQRLPEVVEVGVSGLDDERPRFDVMESDSSPERLQFVRASETHRSALVWGVGIDGAGRIPEHASIRIPSA